MTDALSRRQFLGITVAAGTGLVLGVHLPSPAEAGDSALAPNAFVRVGLDGAVTVVVKHLEMGQGVNTGLPAIVAEELAVPWRSIRVEAAPADAARYNNLLFGRMQGTGGSTATANSYDQLRKAAAAAREMLLEAAAPRLKAPRAELVAEGGQVTHPPSGRAIAYGKLAADAARLTVPQDPPLKDPKDFTIIGKDGAVRRTDSRAKSDGTAQFGLDVRLPGMATAMVVRPPVFGAKLARFDDAKTRKVAGIRAVFAIPSGIAVVADDTWSALKGRDALVVEWQDGEGAALSSDGIRAEFTKLVKTPGLPARADGDVEAALAGDGRKVVATYEVPYLAHAPMEPLNCVVRLAKDKCEIWTGCQFHTVDQAQAARVAGLKPEQVEIHTLFAGGSFGRRANTGSDYIVEAVEVAKRIDGPVRLMWTREDDITGGLYRGCFVHGLEAAIDETGAPIGWRHRLAGQSIAAGTPMEAMMVKDGIDHTSVEGASTLPYAIPNLRVELHSPTLAVPVLAFGRQLT